MKFKWDGKSRPSDDKYRKRWDEIFKKDHDKFSKLQQEQRDLDATMENESQESKTGYSPMVQISLKEYDKLKERAKYITDKDMISVIDKIEELVRALRKHIVRLDIE